MFRFGSGDEIEERIAGIWEVLQETTKALR